MLLSKRDANPPVFTFYFEVTSTPPTTVTCSINNNTFNITEKDLNHVPEITADPIRVGVTVTIRRREAGEYSCTIRTDISVSPAPFNTTATTPGINISGKILFFYVIMLLLQILVTNTPSNVTYTKTGQTSILLVWSLPNSNTSTVIGYEVFLYISNRTRVSIETNTTELNITSLQLNESYYIIFVVAYGGDLPSDHSSAIVISQGKQCHY